MASERYSSGLIAIVVALIGLAGSLGVAWITTRAQFAKELDGKAGEIAQLRKDLDAAQTKLALQREEMDKKVAAVEDRLKKLDYQIELAQAAAGRLMKVGSLFGGGKKGETH